MRARTHRTIRQRTRPTPIPRESVRLDQSKWTISGGPSPAPRLSIRDCSDLSALGARANGVYIVADLSVTNDKTGSVTITNSDAVSLVADGKTYDGDSDAQTALIGAGAWTFLLNDLGPGAGGQGRSCIRRGAFGLGRTSPSSGSMNSGSVRRTPTSRCPHWRPSNVAQLEPSRLGSADLVVVHCGALWWPTTTLAVFDSAGPASRPADRRCSRRLRRHSDRWRRCLRPAEKRSRAHRWATNGGRRWTMRRPQHYRML